MSDIKVSDLAKELNVTSKEVIDAVADVIGKKVRATSKIEEEVAELVREALSSEEVVEEEKPEEKEEKKGKVYKVFDVSHELNIPFDELKEKLRVVGYTGEITNFSEFGEDIYNKLLDYIKEEEKRKKELEEQRKREEEEKKKQIEERRRKAREELKAKKEAEEKPKTEIKKETPEIKKEEKVEKKKEITVEEKTKEAPKKEVKFEKKEERKPQPEKKEKTQEIKPAAKKVEEKKEEKKKEEKKEIKKPVSEPERISKKEKEEKEALRKLLGQQPKKKKTKAKRKKEKLAKAAVEEKEKEEELKIVEIPEVLTVKELSDLIDVPVNEILGELFQKGMLMTINQTIDPELAVEIAEEHGYLAEIKKEGEEETTVETEEEATSEENLVERPPVVTVMGHVDHGKTSLLDAIRKTDVAAKEKGGITQHIGAYKIKLPNGKEITFLDTPGHEAFTTLRARGSKVADIAVLVVAADDGVKPQTVEAIDHAKSAGLPIIVAINKIDKPGADPERVKRELAQYHLIPEEWGGDTIMVPVSAKTGQNLDELEEMILLVSEVLDLKANPNRPAVGTVIESKLDPKRGVVATVLIQNGTLHVGDYFVAGYTWGKVRAMFDERGNRLKKAGPGTPVEILGFQEIPNAGDKFIVKPSEREARQLAEMRKQKRDEEILAKRGRLSLENLKDVKEVNIILKADVQGSLEALKKSIEELSEKFEDVSINIIHSGIGGITESDVMLAAASNAIIIGFNVRPDAAARRAAEEEGVEIKLYGIIYEVLEDLEKALKGLLKPVEKEKLLGTCEVKQIFRAKGIGTIAGCIVTEGVIRRDAKARLVRDGIVIYDGEINSLKRFKEDVKEVAKGYECGLTLKDFNDIKPGDIIEAYEMVAEPQE